MFGFGRHIYRHMLSLGLLLLCLLVTSLMYNYTAITTYLYSSSITSTTTTRLPAAATSTQYDEQTTTTTIPIMSTNRNTRRNNSAAICCIQKGGVPNIDEWVDYHLAIGFDTIYIYDDSNSFETREWHRRRFGNTNTNTNSKCAYE